MELQDPAEQEELQLPLHRGVLRSKPVTEFRHIVDLQSRTQPLVKVARSISSVVLPDKQSEALLADARTHTHAKAPFTSAQQSSDSSSVRALSRVSCRAFPAPSAVVR